MRRAVFFALAAVILIVVATALAWQKRSPDAASQSPDFKSVKARWHGIFEQESPEKAYADFLKAAGTMSYDSAHTLSHIVGEELYARLGEEGLALCTTDFGFGCYHGLAGAALSARGLGAIKDLSAPCESMDRGGYLGCIHGIGHGILAFLGNEHIREALDACSPAQKSESIGGCYGGVVMEYNYNTMQSATGIALRPFDEAHAYEPCLSLAPKYREACMYEAPSWWHASMNSTSSSTQQQFFKKVGALCEGVRDIDLRKICYRGAGNVVGPRSGYDYAEMKALCNLMPDAVAQNTCLMEALPHLLQSEDGRAQLRVLCASKEVAAPSVCAGDAL